MQVSLIHFTGRGTADEQWYAARLLAFTKATRLQMTPDGFNAFEALPTTNIKAEMEYMSATIASSWEFVNLVFAVNGISRACAQQMTRTRTASFAMQSQRVTDMTDVTFDIPPNLPQDLHGHYKFAFYNAKQSYSEMVKGGAALEDARGVLPINVHCNLIAKYNLRAWVDLIRARDSLRVQGEYHEVIHQMKAAVLKVWPWALTFIEPKSAKAIAIIEEVASTLPQETKIKLAKAADLLKKETA
jgi:flavin-dependent thymidylate synthase